MNVKAYVVNSFAREIEGGNPAGVVLHADSLSEGDMKRTAGILGHSETAFVMGSGLADFKLRFFTPTEEVDLCGHATIGAFFVMARLGLAPAGRYRQETKAGVLEVLVKEDSQILMDQAMPEFLQILDKGEIAASLNAASTDLREDLPVQIVSTGLKDILVPVKSRAILNALLPDMKAITEISRAHGVVGYHAFTLETLHGGTAHCRNFAPLYGIPEESATGTSSGALACYLYSHGMLDDRQAGRLSFEQGYSMGKASEITASLLVDSGKILKVRVGGGAMNLRERDLEI